MNTAIKPRRPLHDNEPDGLQESDRDFVLNNLPAAVELLENAERLQEVIRDMDRSAEAGLCYFTLGSAREFLKDIRRKAKEAGIQGGLTEFKS